MAGTPKVNIDVVNEAKNVSTPSTGITFFQGITLRGPVSDPKTIISNWTQFTKLFGGLLNTSDFPLLCKRALDAGSRLRVNRITHFSGGVTTAVKGAMNPVKLLTFAGALVSSNVINLTVNGVAIAPVTFTTDNDTTLGLIKDAILAVAPTLVEGSVVAVTGAVDNDRVIRLVPKTATEILITSIVVTLGAGQTTGAMTSEVGFNMLTKDAILFKLTPKYEGLDYNNLKYTISAASNGGATYFDLTITHLVDSAITETYRNLTIPTTNPTVPNSHYLDTIITDSVLVDVTYSDLSSLTGQLRPDNHDWFTIGGADGDAVVAADYAGISSDRSGFYAFDPYNDSYQVTSPEIATDTVHIAGVAYAAARKDIQYWAHLENMSTATALIAERDALSVDSKYIAFFSGGDRITHPTTGAEVILSELGIAAGLAASSESNFYPWLSFMGKNRGVALGSLGPKVNYGGAGSVSDMDDLASRGINMFINRDGKNMLWGNHSGYMGSDTPENFENVVRLVLYMQKALRPTLEDFLDEPTDIPMAKQLYLTVLPWLKEMLTKRAVYDLSWEGDQNADTLADLQVNTATDFQKGKYKIRFKITPIPGLNEITLEIVLSPAGVSFNS